MPLPDMAGDPVADTLTIYNTHATRYAHGWLTYSPAPEGVDLAALVSEGLPVGARVLDVGSGSGRDLGRLRQLGLNATGVDANVQLAEHASQFGPVVVADMRDLPFLEASFDAVLAAASVLHLPATDAAHGLAHIARVLRPGRRLVMSVKAGHGAITGRFFQLYDDQMLDRLLQHAGLHVTSDVRTGTTWLIRVAVR